MEYVIGQKQARALAQMIYKDVHQYCLDHREEYEKFIMEESRGKNKEKSNGGKNGDR